LRKRKTGTTNIIHSERTVINTVRNQSMKAKLIILNNSGVCYLLRRNKGEKREPGFREAG
jgi:hypothetical protein